MLNSMASWLAQAATAMGAIFKGKDVGWEHLVEACKAVSVSNGGLPSCADASCNLANPAHVDVCDAWRSYAVWTVRRNGQGVAGWWFLVHCLGAYSNHAPSLCMRPLAFSS